MKLIAIVVAAAAIIGFGWVFSLPSKAECAASGRIVDPTERHSENPGGGYQQLQEHALFHSREVVLGAAILLGAAYGIHRLRRRRAPSASPSA